MNFYEIFQGILGNDWLTLGLILKLGHAAMSFAFYSRHMLRECYVQSSIEFRVLKLEFRALPE